jgi:hypothetical protein
VLMKKVIALTVSSILLIVGLLLFSVNFISPHTFLIEVSNQDTRSLGAIEDFHLNSYYPKMIQPSTDDIYRYLPAVNVTAGQTLRVFWYSDVFLTVYIFSEEQFTHFQSILPNINFSGISNFDAWADENGITFEASGWAKRNEIVSYNVTETGDYVAVITNGGLVNAGVSYFSLDLIFTNQTTEKQSDSLYLYSGIGLIIIGILSFVVTLRHRKTL